MHKFLRAVGFSKITKEELNDIFQKIIERPMLQKVAEDSEGNCRTLYRVWRFLWTVFERNI